MRGSIAKLTFLLASLSAGQARAQLPDGVFLMTALGEESRTFGSADRRTLLVEVPRSLGESARELGVVAIANGVGVFQGTSTALEALRSRHPGLRAELAPLLRPMLEVAGPAVRASTAHGSGLSGRGALVAIIDTGLDVTHPDFRNPDGTTRVEWLLDFSQSPWGVHPAVEEAFGARIGTTRLGAVLAREDIDALLNGTKAPPPGGKVPTDDRGHGTHVAGIAASGHGRFRGVAPEAGLIIVNGNRSNPDGSPGDGSANAADVLLGATFVFDRAAVMGRPAVVNLSLGGGLMPRDGSTLVERALSGLIGDDKPGRAIVAAAGNEGSLLEPIHQQVVVREGERVLVPIDSSGQTIPISSPELLVVVRPGSTLRVGLDQPEGRWITPFARNGCETESPQVCSKQGSWNDARAQIVAIPSIVRELSTSDAPSFFVKWQGKWPKGTYPLVLEGAGVADIYMPVSRNLDGATRLRNGVREGTISPPASHPAIIAVGCTANRTEFRGLDGVHIPATTPRYDEQGGVLYPDPLPVLLGQQCSFSGSGPNGAGALKPDIAAPGFAVVSSLSGPADPATQAKSMFGGCDRLPCLRSKADDTHAVTTGTSMSAPMVAGAVALLLQRDPTLTQARVRDVLQAGAARFRAPMPFMAQSGPGELDVVGALRALDVMTSAGSAGAPRRPSSEKSRLHLSVDLAIPTLHPVHALVHLRDDRDEIADVADARELSMLIEAGTERFERPVLKRAPGLWALSFDVPPMQEGNMLTVTARLGDRVLTAKSIPIGRDPWRTRYPSRARGGCAVGGDASAPLGVAMLAALACVVCTRRLQTVRSRSVNRPSNLSTLRPQGHAWSGHTSSHPSARAKRYFSRAIRKISSLASRLHQSSCKREKNDEERDRCSGVRVRRSRDGLLEQHGCDGERRPDVARVAASE